MAIHAGRDTACGPGGRGSKNVLNRGVAIIKPRQPYLDWGRCLPVPPVDLTLDELRTDCTAILIPDFDDPAGAETFIAGIAVDLFELELDPWDRDPETWPHDRSYETFRE